MLADFPQAAIILVRRRLADIEGSLTRALLWTRGAPFASPWQRPLLLEVYRLALRRRVYRLARSVRRLPIDRVALLSYDELRADPEAGAACARRRSARAS